MASPSIKKSQPKHNTGTTKAMNNQKQALRSEVGIPTRPAVPDDANNLPTYRNWKPGQLRPFMAVHIFNADRPASVICKGPQGSVGGKLNGIPNEERMNSHALFGKNGWSK